jgi:hypothetical protein
VCDLVSLQINFLFLLRLHDVVIIYMVESLSRFAGLLTLRLSCRMDTVYLKDTRLRKKNRSLMYRTSYSVENPKECRMSLKIGQSTFHILVLCDPGEMT